MPLDVHGLMNFYDSPLGEISKRLVGRVIRSRWDNTAGLSVAALGYGIPFLDRFHENSRRCLALMPAEQGVVIWPGGGHCAAALVEAPMLPLPDGSVDRLLLAHALESAEQPEALMEEVWRITAPEGRILIIVPSRRGVWARADGTPYGHGLPYSKAQLRELLHRTVLYPIYWGEALYAPPFNRPFFIRSAPALERLGNALALPFAGVHIVEAIKQIYRPASSHSRARARRSSRVPALAPSLQRQA